MARCDQKDSRELVPHVGTRPASNPYRGTYSPGTNSPGILFRGRSVQYDVNGKYSKRSSANKNRHVYLHKRKNRGNCCVLAANFVHVGIASIHPTEGKAMGDKMGNTINELQEELRISPLFNDVFLRIFGRQDSKSVTRSLVNAVLNGAGLPCIGNIKELRADAASAGGIELRTARTDVLVISEEGTVVDVEAQRQYANVDNKALFYASKLLCEHTPKGGDDRYGNLPQVVVITLLEGHEMFDGDQFVSVGRVRWDRGSEHHVNGSDRIILVAVELDKVRKRYTASDEEVATDESLAWLYLLAEGYRDDREMDEIMEKFQTMQEFADRYKLAMGDPELKRAYDKYLEARMEYNEMVYQDKLVARRDGLEEGRREGRREGLQEGRQEGIDSMVERMRELGYEEDAITSILDGLTTPPQEGD